MFRLGIIGVLGKMGKRISLLALKEKDIVLAAAIERENHPETGVDLGSVLNGRAIGVKITSDLSKAAKDVDCLIDFTLPESTMKNLAVCVKRKIPVVIATTGLDEKAEKKIKEAAKKIPVVFSPNMAIGVNVLFKLVAETARVLCPDFSVKIDETHHVYKKDSPSGTAKKIAKIIEGITDIYPQIDAFREGEIVGNHGIIFENEYEKLEIRHDAKTRDVFAMGAIKAARFIHKRKKGLYSMKDVLGL